MTDWNLDDIEGLPTDPVELRAWFAKLRALFRTWADVTPRSTPEGTPEAAFKKASKLMAEIRVHLGMPPIEVEIEARRATASAPEVVQITVDQIKAGKFTRYGMGDGSDKHGKWAIHFSRSIACDRLVMAHKFWLRKLPDTPVDVYSFHVDADMIPGEGSPSFPTVTDAVAYINANPKAAA